MLEAHPREIHRDLRAAHAMMAYDNGLALWIELRQARRDVAHRDVVRAGERRNRNLKRLAHVEDKNALAPIEAGLERRRFDCADIRHQATKETAGALLFDIVRKQLNLREVRQVPA